MTARFFAVVFSVASVACNGGSRPAPSTAPVPLAALDPVFNLSVVPARPSTAALATLDTNDAHEYYDAGLVAMDTNAAVASAAFYWASRLDPSWAEPYFARWYLLLSAEPRAISDSVRRSVDALGRLALLLDPFVDEQVSLTGRSDRRVPDWYFAFSGRRFDLASQELARLIAKHPDMVVLYHYRARAAYYLGQYDTAAAILQVAINRITARDTSRLNRQHLSHALLTYSMALAYQRAHRDSAAMAALQQTLTENLGLYMAHLHMASELLEAHHPTAAIIEANYAAQVRPDDPVVQLFLGLTLLNAHHPEDAVGPLRAAIAADPYYALPYYYLGQASEFVGDNRGAVAGYRGYLARAKRREYLRESAEHEIARLGGT